MNALAEKLAEDVLTLPDDDRAALADGEEIDLRLGRDALGELRLKGRRHGLRRLLALAST